MPTGEEPVGRPRTKGCSFVGLKALILSDGGGYVRLWGRECGGSTAVGLTNDVLGNVG